MEINLTTLREKLEKKFDELYERAQTVLKKYNPCAVSIINGKSNCMACKIKSSGTHPNTLCCTDCEFHTNKGCVADKPLFCKVWLCEEAAEKSPNCKKELDLIKNEMMEFSLGVFRGEKSDSINKSFNHFEWVSEQYKSRLNQINKVLAI